MTAKERLVNSLDGFSRSIHCTGEDRAAIQFAIGVISNLCDWLGEIEEFVPLSDSTPGPDDLIELANHEFSCFPCIVDKNGDFWELTDHFGMIELGFRPTHWRYRESRTIPVS